jgi:hypothetical protein
MKIKENIAVSASGFVFDPTTGDSYSLNPVAVEFFELMKQGADQEEVKKAIQEKYDVGDSEFEKSFIDFQNMLSQFHLLQLDTTTDGEK